MREILFRGKEFSGDWVYGSFLEGCMDDAALIVKTNKEKMLKHTIAVIPETVGQYTGLTDKNGKKIFEGDIFAHPNKKKYKYVVDWIDDIASFSWFNGDGVGFDNKEIEIIGNIHDNPELLGGDK